MNPASSFHSRSSRSMALLIALVILVLVTILVVSFTTLMRQEGMAARGHYDRQAALAAANQGFGIALASLRDAIGTNSFWSSQPGRLVVFNADGTVSANVPLYPTATNNGTIDMNQRSYSGVAPIGGGTTTPMPVGWVNVLRDPTQGSASNNPVTGRFAWWIDDESSKLNVNTADGTAKGTASSFGEGFPTEASLGALNLGGGTNAAAAIASLASSSGFSSEGEIVRASGVALADVLTNRFSLTAFSRSPEMNIFGEPKIYLFPVLTNGTSLTNSMVGPYGSMSWPAPNTWPGGGLLNQIYPTSAQLPNFVKAPALVGMPLSNLPLPEFFAQDMDPTAGFSLKTNNPNFAAAARIAQYLAGYNSAGTAITWPTFPGSGTGGFMAKYTPRQIDSIALQIADLVGQSVQADGYRNVSLPYILPKGFLSGKPVIGIGRCPRATQVLFKITPTTVLDPTYGSYLTLNIELEVEWFFPPQFAGVNNPFAAGGGWKYGGLPNPNFQILNYNDAPQISGTSPAVVLGASPLSTNAAYNVGNYTSGVIANNYWMNNLLRITDQNGTDAGVDLFGNDPDQIDPDPRAAAMHPWTARIAGGVTNYYGTGQIPGSVAPALNINFPANGTAWQPGEYRTTCNYYGAISAFPTKPNVTSINVSGGLAIWANIGSGIAGEQFNPVPFDSLHGTTTFAEDIGDATVQRQLLLAVLPINLQNVQPGITRVVHLWVKDPLVNQFPGDWQIDNDASTIPAVGRSSVAVYYSPARNYPGYTAADADPGTLWMPPQTGAIPKSQRFSSVGLLQYVHTGTMPDYATDSLPIDQQTGTPWRVLDFAPSADPSQKTAGGASYPDWALLDLFTVPASPQPLGGGPYRNLTSGGSTAGRINPNGGAIFPAAWGLSRTTPLAAVFQGLPVVSYTGATAVTNAISPTAAQQIAAGIAAYLQANGAGAFRTAGEIANVPEVAAYLSTNQPAAIRSRNDAVRQAIGLLSPRAGVFSVWVTGQSIQKSKGNTGYGVVESGDRVTGEIRMRYVVERYLDLGMDGVPGNAKNPGTDRVVGTWDDPVDSASAHPYYNPSNPSYKYRVIYAEQVDNN